MRRFLVGLMVFLALVNQVSADTTIFNSLPYNLQNGTTADATQVMANFNQIIANGNANAAAKGTNSTISALTGLTSPPTGQGSLFFNGTTVGGSANTITIGTTFPSGMTYATGTCLWFQGALPNTGATTINVLSLGAVSVTKNGPNGAVALGGGEIGAGSAPSAVCYDGTDFRLLNPSNNAEMPESWSNLASAATTSLSAAACPNFKCSITGTTTITSFGSTPTTGQVFYVRFNNVLTLTYNATSMILPGAANITTAPNDTAMAVYLGSGNWQVLRYDVAVQPLFLIAAAPSRASGLIVTNNGTTPDTKVDITATYAVLGNSTHTAALACQNISSTVNLATNGAVNTLDTGSLATTTWYYLYIISDGSTCGGLGSASSTSPTLPTGYSYYTRVGAMATDGAVHLYRTRQVGRRAQYQVTASTNTPAMPILLSGSTGSITTPTWTATQVTGNGKVAPATAEEIKIMLGGNGVTNSVGEMAAPNANYGAYNSSTNPPPCVYYGGNAAALPLINSLCSMVLESNSIYLASSAGTNTLVTVLGWIDGVSAD